MEFFATARKGFWEFESSYGGKNLNEKKLKNAMKQNEGRSERFASYKYNYIRKGALE